MPAYGKNLSPAEVNALVSFMETLHSKSRPAARDSMVPSNPTAVGSPTS
jgi:ubiquinol-cytochrome c reductase cytochrome b subunit